MRILGIVLLLSLLASPTFGVVACYDLASDPCELPIEFAHRVVIEEAGIRTTFASVRSSYVAGETIEFRLLLENIGTEYFCMNFLHSPIDAVFIFPENCADLGSCLVESPWYYPNTVFFAAAAGVGLDPGECRVFSHSWDTSTRPAAPGDYLARGGLFERTVSGEIEFRMPAEGASFPLRIEDGTPVDRISTGTLKALWK